MTLCEHCEHEIGAGTTCVRVRIQTADGEMNPTRYGEEFHDRGAELGYTCGDCGVAPGGYHHPTCDLEECPRCLGQLLSCECEIKEEEPA